jgi:hypothetical protein
VCIIFTCDAGRPDDDLLEEANFRNSDGAGVAWVEDKKVLWKKGLDVKQVQKLIPKLKYPYMIHFRSASIGPNVSALTHPFPLTPKVSLDLLGSASSVLMHNGHWGEWKAAIRGEILSRGLKAPGGHWSDSRAIAFLVNQHGLGILPLILDSDRVAVLNGKGDIITFGTFYPHKGFKASVDIDTNHRWKRDTSQFRTHRGNVTIIDSAGDSCPKPQAPDRSVPTTPTEVAAHHLVALPPGAYSLEEIAVVLSEIRFEAAS